MPNIVTTGYDNFLPVADEVTAHDLRVTGAVPDDLDGRFVRNGPNPMSGSIDSPEALFLGDGMVHGVRLRGGGAEWYRNRFVGGSALSAARREPDLPGCSWDGSPLGPNTNVVVIAGQVLATVEAVGCPVRFDDELTSVSRHDFEGTLPASFSGHVRHDPDDGTCHAVAYSYGRRDDQVQYIAVGVDGRVSRVVDIPVAGMPMVHDVAITERYAVVFDQPVLYRPAVHATGGMPLTWAPERGSRFGLLPRHGEAADIVWVDVPVAFSFHVMNAFDRADGTVVVDHCVYESMFARPDQAVDDGVAHLERWVLDPVARTSSRTQVSDVPSELPGVRPSVVGREHRFGYTASLVAGDWPTVKFDLGSGSWEVFSHGPGRSAGEPVFVPRPGGSAEDDGWILTYVFDAGTGGSELAILDAQDLGRGYVARVHLPQRVPNGFHGSWIPDSTVSPRGVRRDDP